MNVEQAIQTIIARTQVYEQRNGASDYTAKSAEVINALLDYYHKSKQAETKYNELLVRYKSICAITNNPYQRVPLEYLPTIEQLHRDGDVLTQHDVKWLLLTIEFYEWELDRIIEQITYFDTLAESTDKYRLMQVLDEYNHLITYYSIHDVEQVKHTFRVRNAHNVAREFLHIIC